MLPRTHFDIFYSFELVSRHCFLRISHLERSVVHPLKYFVDKVMEMTKQFDWFEIQSYEILAN